jgi:hypothetical protein
LATAKHMTYTNASNSGGIIGLLVSPCRGTTSNATAAMCSQDKKYNSEICKHTMNTFTKEIHDAPRQELDNSPKEWME